MALAGSIEELRVGKAGKGHFWQRSVSLGEDYAAASAR
jgi:hypothetical protein